MTLCKISEGGLEQLSIAESGDLYGSEAPNEATKRYTERLERRVEEGRLFKLRNARGYGADARPAGAGDKSGLGQVGSRVKPAGPHPGIRSPIKMQGNTKQHVFFKKLAGRKRDLISMGNASSELGGAAESHFRRQYRRSREKVHGARPSVRRNGSLPGSNGDSHSAHRSLEKSQRSSVHPSNAHSQGAPSVGLFTYFGNARAGQGLTGPGGHRRGKATAARQQERPGAFSSGSPVPGSGGVVTDSEPNSAGLAGAGLFNNSKTTD